MLKGIFAQSWPGWMTWNTRYKSFLYTYIFWTLRVSDICKDTKSSADSLKGSTVCFETNAWLSLLINRHIKSFLIIWFVKSSLHISNNSLKLVTKLHISTFNFEIFPFSLNPFLFSLSFFLYFQILVIKSKFGYFT